MMILALSCVVLLCCCCSAFIAACMFGVSWSGYISGEGGSAESALSSCIGG